MLSAINFEWKLRNESNIDVWHRNSGEFLTFSNLSSRYKSKADEIELTKMSYEAKDKYKTVMRFISDFRTQTRISHPNKLNAVWVPSFVKWEKSKAKKLDFVWKCTMFGSDPKATATVDGFALVYLQMEIR